MAYPAWSRLAATRAGTDGAWLGAQIDAGRPLVEGLAHRFAVRPVALRSALRRLPAFAPPLSLRALAVLLDALPPECHPRDAQGWHRLTKMLAIADRCFESLRSPAAIAWLRSVTRPSRTIARVDERALTQRAALIARLAPLLARQLVLAARRAPRPRSIMRQARRLARQYLAALDPGQQGELAAAVARVLPAALAQPPVEPTLASQAVAAAAAALPAWRSRDGRRRIVSFVRHAEQLPQIGSALANCLANARTRASYAARLQARASCFVTVTDATSGTLLSAAELQLDQHRDGAHGVAATIVDHRSANDRAPSAACQAAVREAAERLDSLPHDRRAAAERLRLRLRCSPPDRQRFARRFVAGFGKDRFAALVRTLLAINADDGADGGAPRSPCRQP